jgi:hypothetical protein
MVVPPGIEPGSGASETLILSIVLRDQNLQLRTINLQLQTPKAAILLPKILTAMAINITPKNFLITDNPLGPKTFSTQRSDFNTTKITTQFIRMPSRILIS